MLINGRDTDLDNTVVLEHSLLTTNHTKVVHEENPLFGDPHHFKVVSVETGRVCSTVDFQEGPVKENGVNGVMNEDLLVMVLTRLNGFQNTKFACKENADAITHIEDALKVLRERTNKRVARNVEGTSQV